MSASYRGVLALLLAISLVAGTFLLPGSTATAQTALQTSDFNYAALNLQRPLVLAVLTAEVTVLNANLRDITTEPPAIVEGELVVASTLSISQVEDVNNGLGIRLRRTGSSSLREYFGTGSLYPNAKVFVATGTPSSLTVVPYSVSSQGGGFSNWSIDDSTQATTVDGIATGDNFIFAIAEPAAVPSIPSAPSITAGSSATARVISWTAPNANGAVIRDYDLRYRQTGTTSWTTQDNVTATSYTATGLAVGTTYEAQVRATNSVGDSGWSASGTGGTSAAVPSIPSAPTVTVVSSSSLTISWTAPNANGEAIRDYDLRYRPRGTLAWTTQDNVTATSYTATGLAPGRTYKAQVRATNSVGDSGWSASGTGRTHAAVPSTPSAPSVTAVSTTSVTISWTAPNANGEGIRDYDLRYRQTGTTSWTTQDNVTATSYTATGLAVGTTYEAQVRATNSVGDSGWSASGTGGTSAAVPSIPSAPTVTASGATALAISWTAPNANGAVIRLYHLRYRQTGTTSWTLQYNISSTSYTATGLAVGTTYEAQVQATNSVGNSGWSASGTGRTSVMATAPSIPSAPSVTAVSISSVTISWTAPNANGAVIRDYDLRYRPRGTLAWTTQDNVTATSYTATGLAPATTYEAQVRATNSVGDSGWSASGTGSTSASVPSTPAAPTVTAVSTTSLAITWTAPANNGSTISSYDLRYKQTGTNSWTGVDDISGLTHTVSGLTVGTEYEAQVRATNNEGDSFYSASGTGSTSASVPSTPAAPTVTVVSTTSLAITWTAPANNGSTISSYDLRYKQTSTNSWTGVDDISGLTHTVSGLTVGTEYEAQVRATNNEGDSFYSASGTGSTSASVPSIPSAPSVTGVSTTSVAISWTAPNANGEAIRDYDLRYRQTGTTSWTTQDNVTATSYTATGLAVGTTYEAQVRATNSVGDSGWSASGTGRTRAAVPSIPSAPSVTASSATALAISWTAPNANGAVIRDYDLRYRQTGTTSWTPQTNVTATSFTATGLAVATTYEAQVRATNSVGDSGWSASGTGGTRAAVPSIPSAPTVTAVSTTSVTISWTAPNANGEAIRDYDLRYRQTGTTSWTPQNDRTGTSYTATGLAVATTYEAQVRATNSVGDSGWSASGTGRTRSAVPSIPSAPSVTAVSTTSVTISWTAPNANGEAIRDYDLRYRQTGTTSWTPQNDRTGTSYTATGLAVGTTYEAQVRATNSVGDSGWSASGTGRTRSAVPSIPSAPSVTAVSTTSVTISWTAPNANGEVIRDYDLRYRQTGTTSWTTQDNVTATSFTATGLAVATTYEAQVRATNSVGDSGWSGLGTGRTRSAVPSTPSVPSVTASSATALAISWTAPNANGEAIRDYDLRYRQTGTTSWTTQANVTATSYTATGLAVATTYEAQVRATNSVGDSGWSASGTGRTRSAVPSTPSAPSVTAVSISSVTISWTAPNANGEAIRDYDLRYRQTGTTSWTTQDNVRSTSYTATGLAPTTTYEAQVRATNSVGDSGWSASGTGDTLPVPSQPIGLDAEALAWYEITLTWNFPGDNTITGYRIERREGEGEMFGVLEVRFGNADTTSYVDATTKAFISYGYRIQAVSATGVSAWSEVAREATGALDSPSGIDQSFTVPVVLSPQSSVVSGQFLPVDGSFLLVLRNNGQLTSDGADTDIVDATTGESVAALVPFTTAAGTGGQHPDALIFIMPRSLPRQVTVMGSRFFIVDDSQDYMRGFDLDGNREAGDDFSLGGPAIWVGGAATDTRFLLLDSQSGSLRVFRHDGSRVPAEDFDLSAISSGVWAGIAVTDTRIYLLNRSRNMVYSMGLDGTRHQAEDISIGRAGSSSGTLWRGITATPTRLYVLASSSNTTDLIRAWDYSGTAHLGDGFTVSSSSSSSHTYLGLASTDDRLFVLRTGSNPDQIVAYDFQGNPQSGDNFVTTGVESRGLIYLPGSSDQGSVVYEYRGGLAGANRRDWGIPFPTPASSVTIGNDPSVRYTGGDGNGFEATIQMAPFVLDASAKSYRLASHSGPTPWTLTHTSGTTPLSLGSISFRMGSAQPVTQSLNQEDAGAAIRFGYVGTGASTGNLVLQVGQGPEARRSVSQRLRMNDELQLSGGQSGEVLSFSLSAWGREQPDLRLEFNPGDIFHTTSGTGSGRNTTRYAGYIADRSPTPLAEGRVKWAWPDNPNPPAVIRTTTRALQFAAAPVPTPSSGGVGLRVDFTMPNDPPATYTPGFSPLIDGAQEAAQNSGLPSNAWWLSVAITLGVVVSGLTYRRLRSLWVASGVGLLVLVGLSAIAGTFGLWVLVVYAMGAMAIIGIHQWGGTRV